MPTENDKKQFDLLENVLYDLKSRTYDIGKGIGLAADIARQLNHPEDRAAAVMYLESTKATIEMVFDNMNKFQDWMKSRQ